MSFPEFSPNLNVTFCLSAEDGRFLRKEAARRGITTDDLVNEIIAGLREEKPNHVEESKTELEDSLHDYLHPDPEREKQLGAILSDAIRLYRRKRA